MKTVNIFTLFAGIAILFSEAYINHINMVVVLGILLITMSLLGMIKELKNK